VLTEAAARWMLVLHTAVGVAAVGSATHLVIWLRKYVRGQSGRRRAVLRFAWLVLALQLGAFVAGNVMYPTYKVEVRAAYLENAGAITAAEQAKARELEKLAARESAERHEPSATVEIVKRAAQAARWFDVKEHWVALGVFTMAALILILSLWSPKGDGDVIAPIVMSLAVVVAGTVWLGAIVGVLTASWRAV
jgi:cell division protein FtsB